MDQNPYESPQVTDQFKQTIRKRTKLPSLLFILAGLVIFFTLDFALYPRPDFSLTHATRSRGGTAPLFPASRRSCKALRLPVSQVLKERPVLIGPQAAPRRVTRPQRVREQKQRRAIRVLKVPTTWGGANLPTQVRVGHHSFCTGCNHFDPTQLASQAPITRFRPPIPDSGARQHRSNHPPPSAIPIPFHCQLLAASFPLETRANRKLPPRMVPGSRNHHLHRLPGRDRLIRHRHTAAQQRHYEHCRDESIHDLARVKEAWLEPPLFYPTSRGVSIPHFS